MLKPGPRARGPQIREHAKLAAQLQERRFRAFGGRQRVKGRIADRAQQDGIGPFGGGERVIGKGRQALPERGAADWMGVEGPAVSESGADPLEHPNRRADDFGTNPVAGQQDDTRVHTPNP